MSVTVKYKGNSIAELTENGTKTLKTSGKYCEADIVVENTKDGGITPSGNINITDTNVTDVTNYATAQVIDADLVAENIKKDVNILGIVGSFEGGGGSLPSVISKIDGGSFTPASDTEIDIYDIHHNLAAPPAGFAIWSDNAGGSYSVYTLKNASSINNSTAAYSYFTSDETERLLTNAKWSGTSTTFIVKRNGVMHYKAGTTYKWLAWA